MRGSRRNLRLLALLLSLLVLSGCYAPVGTNIGQTIVPAATAQPARATARPAAALTQAPIARDGRYNARDEVALYIRLYGELPGNYITKAEARKLGWTSGSVERVAPGMAIGGDRFGNYEGLLPERKGRQYTECDIDTWGRSSRGAKRIVFSSDGLIFYTNDHYESFEQLY